MYYAICCNCSKVMMRSSISTFLRSTLHSVDGLGRNSTVLRTSCSTVSPIEFLSTLPFLTPLSAYNSSQARILDAEISRVQCLRIQISHYLAWQGHISHALNAIELACYLTKLDTSSSIIKRSMELHRLVLKGLNTDTSKGYNVCVWFGKRIRMIFILIAFSTMRQVVLS